MKPLHAFTLLILGMLLWALPVSAQDPTTRAQSRELFDMGYAADKAGDPGRAVELYKQSFELYPSYDVAGNLGVLEVKLERFADAANHLSYCLRHFPTGESAKLRGLIEENLKRAQEEVGAVRVEVDEVGAAITIGNQQVGHSPLEHEVYLVPGQYGVRATAGAQAAESVFAVRRGEVTRVALSLAPKVPDVARPAGTPSAPEQVTPTHPRRPSLVPGYVLGGVTVAALASSAVFGVVAGAKQRKVDDLRPASTVGCTSTRSSSCDELERLVNQHDDLGRASNITLVVGAVGAAATIGYLTYALLQRKRRAPSAAAVSFDDNGGMFFLSGSF